MIDIKSYWKQGTERKKIYILELSLSEDYHQLLLNRIHNSSQEKGRNQSHLGGFKPIITQYKCQETGVFDNNSTVELFIHMTTQNMSCSI